MNDHVNDQAERIEGFLRANGWATATRQPFAADWSQRYYERLTREEKPATAILMVAEPNTSFMQFVRVAGLLRRLGAAAPLIYAADTLQGFMLLEDFGDRNLGRLLDNGADTRDVLFRGVDVLIELHKAWTPQHQKAVTLPVYDAARFVELIKPFIDDFIPAFRGSKLQKPERNTFYNLWRELLAPPMALPQKIMLRDFMADNLMDLSQPPFSRSGWQATGLLDFELTGVGPIAYDLASLIEQVRRGIPDDVRGAVLARYLAAFPQLDPQQLGETVSILSVQRHMRILGMLSRPAVTPSAQVRQETYVPRIKSFLKQRLEAPVFTSLKAWFGANLGSF